MPVVDAYSVLCRLLGFEFALLPHFCAEKSALIEAFTHAIFCNISAWSPLKWRRCWTAEASLLRRSGRRRDCSRSGQNGDSAATSKSMAAGSGQPRSGAGFPKQQATPPQGIDPSLGLLFSIALHAQYVTALSLPPSHPNRCLSSRILKRLVPPAGHVAAGDQPIQFDFGRAQSAQGVYLTVLGQ